MFGNIFGTLELPKFLKALAYERLTLGGWQLNLVSRLSNGSLIGAPSNVNIIGNYRTAQQTFHHEFNTCYESVNTTTGALTAQPMQVNTSTGLVTLQGCDANNSTPAFAQRLSYTSQNNSTVLNIRQTLYPLLDASLFKRFIIHDGVSFELRGEFFNVLNTSEFGGLIPHSARQIPGRRIKPLCGLSAGATLSSEQCAHWPVDGASQLLIPLTSEFRPAASRSELLFRVTTRENMWVMILLTLLLQSRSHVVFVWGRKV